jgi:hypothetical protein
MTVRTHGLFQKTMPSYVHAKGSDYIYGRNEVGIDTGVLIEGEGTLFLGRVALQEMGEVMGWTFVEDADEIARQYQEDLAWRDHEIKRLAEENAALTADLEAFGRALAGQARVKAAE